MGDLAGKNFARSAVQVADAADDVPRTVSSSGGGISVGVLLATWVKEGARPARPGVKAVVPKAGSAPAVGFSLDELLLSELDSESSAVARKRGLLLALVVEEVR